MATFKQTSPIGGLKHLKQRIDELDLLKVEIGWFASSQHPEYDEEGQEIGQIPMATIAAKNEFGSPAEYIPPRPFIRPALSENRSTWRSQIIQGTRAIIQGSETDVSVMEKIGLSVAGHIREKITQVHSPKLSQETIEKRLEIRADKTTIGNLDKPLVFEGILLNSVTYIVQDGEEVTPYETGGA